MRVSLQISGARIFFFLFRITLFSVVAKVKVRSGVEGAASYLKRQA